MSRLIDIAELPDDVATLRGVIGTLLADLSAERAARQAAETGLRDKALEAERLRAQLARLRRTQFGQSSERLRDQIAQLELVSRNWRRSPSKPRSSTSTVLTSRPSELGVTAASRCPSTARAARWSIVPPAAPALSPALSYAGSAPT